MPGREPREVREGLIRLLLNPDAELGDRDDAAMDLGEFDGVDVENALVAVAADATQDETLLDSCGESLAELWARTKRIDPDRWASLQPPARRIASATLKLLDERLWRDVVPTDEGGS